MHECFLAGSGAPDLHHVFEAMEERLCRPISCAGRQQILAHGSLLSARDDAADAGGPGTSYYLLGSALLLGLAALYAVVLCTIGEMRGASGGAGLRSRRRAAWGLWGPGSKPKNF